MRYLLFFLFLFLPIYVSAESGACSNHGGVNCSAGYDIKDGSVICNDGWMNSSVLFSDTKICENYFGCSTSQLNELVEEYELNDLIREIEEKTQEVNIRLEEFNAIGDSGMMGGSQDREKRTLAVEIKGMANEIISLQDSYNFYKDIINDKCSAIGKDFLTKLYFESLSTWNDYQGVLKEEAFQKYSNVIESNNKNNDTNNKNEATLSEILLNRPTKVYIYSFDNGYRGDLLETIYADSTQIQRYNLPTNNIYIEWDSTKTNGFIKEELVTFQKDGTYEEGYWYYKCDKEYYNSNKADWIDCIRSNNKEEIYMSGDNYLAVIGLKKNQKYDFDMSGYYYDDNGQLKDAYHYNVLELTPIVANQFKENNFSEKLKGKILLQVESNGEGWYISPENGKRYFLGRPTDAFNVMRNLGLGVSNKDFDSFKGVAPKRLSGRILLKVEDSGEAYYVNPADLKMYFLGKPSDAFKVMRDLGLGISDNDITKININ